MPNVIKYRKVGHHILKKYLNVNSIGLYIQENVMMTSEKCTLAV